METLTFRLRFLCMGGWCVLRTLLADSSPVYLLHWPGQPCLPAVCPPAGRWRPWLSGSPARAESDATPTACRACSCAAQLRLHWAPWRWQRQSSRRCPSKVGREAVGHCCLGVYTPKRSFNMLTGLITNNNYASLSCAACRRHANRQFHRPRGSDRNNSYVAAMTLFSRCIWSLLSTTAYWFVSGVGS